MPRKTPVILAIDLEPDGFAFDRWNPSAWFGCEEAFPVMEDFRRYARAETGGAPVAFTWTLRMDPQISESYGSADHAMRLFGRQLASVEACGDEIGLHTHFWRWNDATGRWRVDHGNGEWVAHCLRSSFGAFRQTFSRDPDTYRSGDRWHDDASVRLVRQLGAKYDLTPERGEPAAASNHPREEFTGSLPDYTGLPARPYHPSERDFRVPDPEAADGLWMMPLAGGVAGFQPEWRQPWKRKVVELLDPARRWQALYRPYTCRLWSAPAEFSYRLRAYLADPGFCYVALAVRSSGFAIEQERSNMLENLKRTIGILRGARMEFCTPGKTLRFLGLHGAAARVTR